MRRSSSTMRMAGFMARAVWARCARRASPPPRRALGPSRATAASGARPAVPRARPRAGRRPRSFARCSGRQDLAQASARGQPHLHDVRAQVRDAVHLRADGLQVRPLALDQLPQVELRDAQVGLEPDDLAQLLVAQAVEPPPLRVAEPQPLPLARPRPVRPHHRAAGFHAPGHPGRHPRGQARAHPAEARHPHHRLGAAHLRPRPTLAIHLGPRRPHDGQRTRHRQHQPRQHHPPTHLDLLPAAGDAPRPATIREPCAAPPPVSPQLPCGGHVGTALFLQDSLGASCVRNVAATSEIVAARTARRPGPPMRFVQRAGKLLTHEPRMLSGEGNAPAGRRGDPAGRAREPTGRDRGGRG